MSTALALMLAQATSWGDTEPSIERAERLEVIETAAELESALPPEGWRHGSLALKAALLRTSYEEGERWSFRVHAGKKLGDGGRARCLNQLHRHHTWTPGPMWKATTGTDLASTRLCMRGAARVLAHYSATCVSDWKAERDLEGSLARVFAGYGTGTTCSTTGRPWAVNRARKTVQWLKVLEAN